MQQETFADTALKIAIIALTVAFVVTLVWVADWSPWLRTAHVLFFVIAIYGVSTAAQMRADRRLDEVELAAARFGARWGLVGGIAFMSVLTFLPPFQALLTQMAAAFESAPGGYPSAVEARMFLLGVVSTFVAQEAFRSLFAAAWKWSKR